MPVYGVAPEDIERLKADELPVLLRILLGHEARRHGIAPIGIDVACDITVGDGGEDGSIRWTGAPARTDWLPCRDVLFQVKATEMGPQDCYDEVLASSDTTAPPTLKSQVGELLDRGGAYVIFCSRKYNKKLAGKRVEKVRNAFKAVGHANAGVVAIEFMDAGKIADWAGESLAAKMFILDCVGRGTSPRWLTWTELSRYDSHRRTPYISNSQTTEHISALRSLLGQNRRVARIVGPSGVGKTRLALETFRANNGVAEQALSDAMVYIDGEGNFPALIDQIRTWRAQEVTGILVVDECPLVNHQQLAAEVTHADSRFSLLTIDFDTEAVDGRFPQVVLDTAPPETIRSIVEATHPGVPVATLDQVVEYASGFPRIASLLADVDLGTAPLTALDNAPLTSRLLWGRRTPDEKGLRLIQACAVFDRVGWTGRATSERDFVAGLAGLSSAEAFGAGRPFIERRILYSRGDYVRVTPRPLALRLAAEWLQALPPEDGARLITSIPQSMVDAFAQQIERLHWLPQARQLVEEVCRPGGPFDDFEFIDTDLGARILFHLAATNGAPVLALLDRQLGSQQAEDLKRLRRGRRHIVHALERLCWWQDTFERAARLMFSLAVAETESWANNATHQFAQLFQLHLSGTTAPPEDRLRLIDDLTDTTDPVRLGVAIKALARGLETQSWMRAGTVESQGGRSGQRDWTPTSPADYFSYWKEVLERLVSLALMPGPPAALASSAIAEHVRGLLARGAIGEVDHSIRLLHAGGLQVWPAATRALRSSLQFEGTGFSPAVQDRIRALIELLEPVALEDRLRATVTLPAGGELAKENGKHVDLGDRRARSLAEEMARDPEQLIKLLPALLTGEQRYAFSFGARLAEVAQDPPGLLDTVFHALRCAPVPRNPALMLGMFHTIAEADRRSTAHWLDDASSDPELVQWLVDMTSVAKPSAADLQRIVDVFRDSRLEKNALRRLSYGSVLDHLTAGEVCSFTENIHQIDDTATGAVLDVLFMYTWGKDDRWSACEATIRRLLMTPGLFDHALGGDSYHIEESARRLLQPPSEDGELASTLTKEILRWYRANDDAWLQDTGRQLLADLLTLFPVECWQRVGEALEGEFDSFHHRLMLALRPTAFGETPRAATDLVPPSTLLQWARRAAGNAPQILASICRIRRVPSDGDGPYPSWSPVALDMMAEWGTDEHVLAALASNRRSRGWGGSAVPLYESDIQAFQELVKHPSSHVRAWAREELELATRALEAERKKDEEREFGILR